MPSLERIMAVNHHLRLALDQVSDAVIVVENGPLSSPGPKILYANEAMSEATGVPASGLCDVPLGALCEGEVLLKMLVTLSAATGGAVEASAPLNHLQGPPTPCRWSAIQVRDGNGAILNYILTASPDISAAGPGPVPAASSPATSHEVADKQPAAAAATPEGPPRPDEYQQDLVETIRDTARYVAHEFNNALTAILLPVQVAIRQVPDGGDLHSKLQVAYESARRAADLAKDFLDCFRPRPAVRERSRLDSLLGRAMRLATCAQNVNWSLEVAEDLFEAEVDVNQIERVIFNLVRNACQAMPSGGRILVKATNTAVKPSEGHALQPGNYVHISVRDWGPGIPEEHMPHLFHSCFTTKDNGNGCGLPICYQIVREHGGDMYVKSRPNVGTAFLIFLPAAAVRRVASQPVAPVLPAAPVSMPVAAPVIASAPVPLAPLLPPGPAVPPGTSPVPVMNPAPLPSVPATYAPVPGTAPVPAVATVPVQPMLPPLPPRPSTAPVPTAPMVSPFAAFTPPAAPGMPQAPLSAPMAPQPVVPAPVTPPPAAQAPAPPPDDAPPSMLVVDDEDGVRRALMQIGKVYGFEVITASTSEEGLQFYRDRMRSRRRYDTVLLDLNLRGGLNGVELFEALRRMDPDATVIATSGQYTEGDLERFQELGFAGFLPKPFTLEDFDQVVQEVLAPQ